MKIRLFVVALLFVCVSMPMDGNISLKVTQDTTDLKTLENFLKTAKIVKIETDKYKGRTAPWGVTLDDGATKRQAIFKYVHRPRPTLLPDSYHCEIAAYKVSSLLDFPIVPPVVEREIKGIQGSLQLIVEGCFPMSQQERRGLQPPEPQKFSDALEELFVFESLVNCDRELEDIYIHESDWRVCRVDFSEAFAPEAELFALGKITRCSKTLYNNLLKLDTNEIKSCLQSHLNEEEIEALLKRRELIIDKINSLIQEKGEDAVLF